MVWIKFTLFIMCWNGRTMILWPPSALLKQIWDCQNSFGQTVVTSLPGALLHMTCNFFMPALHWRWPGGGSTGSGHRHLTPGRRKHMQVLDGRRADSGLYSTFNPLNRKHLHSFRQITDILYFWTLVHSFIWTGKVQKIYVLGLHQHINLPS